MNEEEKKRAEELGVDGFIKRITMPNGKIYALQTEVITAKQLVCPRCGSSFQLKYGEGRCEYCGTYFTTKFNLEEVKE